MITAEDVIIHKLCALSVYDWLRLIDSCKDIDTVMVVASAIGLISHNTSNIKTNIKPEGLSRIYYQLAAVIERLGFDADYADV